MKIALIAKAIPEPDGELPWTVEMRAAKRRAERNRPYWLRHGQHQANGVVLSRWVFDQPRNAEDDRQ